jgi:Type III secretion system lipoprotein chaperone (YscW)
VQITGRVRTDWPTRRSAIATAYVRVLDVSRADAAAATIAEVEIEDVKVTAGTSLLVPFTLEVDESLLDPRASYELAAHVDLAGDGTVTVGDYVTTRSIPLLDQRLRGLVDIPVQEVS